MTDTNMKSWDEQILDTSNNQKIFANETRETDQLYNDELEIELNRALADADAALEQKRNHNR